MNSQNFNLDKFYSGESLKISDSLRNQKMYSKFPTNLSGEKYAFIVLIY